MTKQYDTLKLKYENLEEIGHNQAIEQFEKLKARTDQQAKDQNAVIASLKKELAEARKASTSTSETANLQKQVVTLTTSNDTLSSENATLKTSLQLSQNEVKSLEAKLVGARQQLSQLPSTQEGSNKAPGAATTRADLNRSVGPNATDAQKEAKMIQNFYSDLTGLIILGVKRKEGEDVYDCIQTGRNGSKSPHQPRSTLIGPPLTFLSTTLPPLHSNRQHNRQPEDTIRLVVRRSGIRLRAFAR